MKFKFAPKFTLPFPVVTYKPSDVVLRTPPRNKLTFFVNFQLPFSLIISSASCLSLFPAYMLCNLAFSLLKTFATPPYEVANS